MKLFVSLYEHQPLPSHRAQGALLRVEFSKFLVGFADLHPWTDQGDPSLENILQSRGSNHGSLWAKALFFAEVDGRARASGRSLLRGLAWPSSHQLWRSEEAARKPIVKIKWTPRDGPLPEVPGRLRLDFGGRLKLSEFQAWWNGLAKAQRARLDLIEDPWSDEGQGPNDARPFLFSDWISNSHWPNRIFKPARDWSFAEFAERHYRRVVFTHSLDHPLGQAAAIWEASLFYRRYPSLSEVCGFSDLPGIGPFDPLSIHGRMKPPSGTGFGFDEILHGLKWETLQ